MNPHSLVSIADLTKEQILHILDQTRYFEDHQGLKILDGKVVATLFFEPSTRTRLSFETAANRLGARVIGFFQFMISSPFDSRDAWKSQGLSILPYRWAICNKEAGYKKDVLLDR